MARSERGFTGIVVDRLLKAARPITPTGGVALGLLVLSVITIVDYSLGANVQLTAMYVFSPIITAWFATRRDSILVALLAAMISTTVHMGTGSITAQAVPLVLTFLLRFLALASVAVLIAEVRTTTERLEALSMRDELTTLFNRRALVQQLDVEIARSRRHSIPISVIYADVDLFKEVNDRFGHARGDEFLKQIAEVMTLTLRPTDIAARMGGDEFVIVLPETDEPGARGLVARLVRQFAPLEKEYGTGLSMGVASFGTAPESVEAALQAADHDMYATKRARSIERLKSEFPISTPPGSTPPQSTT